MSEFYVEDYVEFGVCDTWSFAMMADDLVNRPPDNAPIDRPVRDDECYRGGNDSLIERVEDNPAVSRPPDNEEIYHAPGVY